ncbi:MAG: response regulator [Candidatus Neomarinimicrobiota bacterium]
MTRKKSLRFIKAISLNDKKITALVVEDSAASLKYMEFLLIKLGVKMVDSASGEKTLEIIDECDVDCMLIDINLGTGMSGIELVERLRQKVELNHLPIFAVTAYSNDEFIDEMLEAGFNNYLTKPYNLDMLRTLLAEYLSLDGTNK